MNLSEVDARNANFTEADFTGAKLDNVVWTGANVEGAKFDENVKEQVLKMI